MCGSAPNAPKEVSSAKCIGGTVLGFGIVTLIGFALGAEPHIVRWEAKAAVGSEG